MQCRARNSRHRSNEQRQGKREGSKTNANRVYSGGRYQFSLFYPFQFLILASDGVWDGITNREAVDIVEQQRDPTRAAKALVKAGLAGMDRNHLEDNATAVVVYFN